MNSAPGNPGLEPRWTSSRKSGVGTALCSESPVWFTLSHGIINEIYYPRIDLANTRDVGLLVSAAGGFFSEEKRHTQHGISLIEEGVPAHRLVNTCDRGRYRITKTILTDPRRPTLLMRIKFEALAGMRSDYRLFVLAAPHIGNQGAGNRGWSGAFKDVPLLYAQRERTAFAIGCSAGWKARSCGFVGVNDGWRQVREHGCLVDAYEEARDGNIALTGEVDLAACDGEFLVVIGFGENPHEAGHMARAALLSDFNDTRDEFVAGWRAFQKNCLPLATGHAARTALYRSSLAILRTHEDKLFHGAIIASLSIPWGARHGDNDIGGYHLVWPRDQTHAAMGLLAAGRVADAQQVIFHLMCTQKPAGNWPQNMWIDGEAKWTANQSDQTASFILLVTALRRHADLGVVDPWASVARAARFLIRNGPVTEQDRWEENPGYTPYTLATMIAALLGAADYADERGDRALACECRSTADQWNGAIERWLYVTGTPLAQKIGVEGYYVRLAPPETKTGEDLKRMKVRLKNFHPPEKGDFTACEVVSADALALVRYGLRAADDPRILNTVRVIDATLRCETKAGPAWRRFTHDGYGEDDKGNPFDGTGTGRSWPVLTGERAHYELACGNRTEAERLLGSLVDMSEHGLLSEQIWDAANLPERALTNGKPTGSALPLVWAHAEFVTLLRSLRDGAVFDCPPQTGRRYR